MTSATKLIQEAERLEQAADRLEAAQAKKDDCGCDVAAGVARGIATVVTASLFGVSL